MPNPTIKGQTRLAHLELLATVEGCQHKKEHVRYLAPPFKWCSYCGAVKVDDHYALWQKPHLGREVKR